MTHALRKSWYEIHIWKTKVCGRRGEKLDESIPCQGGKEPSDYPSKGVGQNGGNPLNKGAWYCFVISGVAVVTNAFFFFRRPTRGSFWHLALPFLIFKGNIYIDLTDAVSDGREKHGHKQNFVIVAVYLSNLDRQLTRQDGVCCLEALTTVVTFLEIINHPPPQHKWKNNKTVMA